MLRAAPGVQPRYYGQASLDWVSIDVADDGALVGMVAHPLGSKSAAEERAVSSIPAIEVTHVAVEDPLHDSG